MNTNTALIHNGAFQPKRARQSPVSRGVQSYPNLMGQRVIYWPSGTEFLERFQTWDHARDECRTLARRLIRLCKQHDQTFTHIRLFFNTLPDCQIATEYRAIVSKHPPNVVMTTVTALWRFERYEKQDARLITSIRPCIDRNQSTFPFPYRVVDVRLSVR